MRARIPGWLLLTVWGCVLAEEALQRPAPAEIRSHISGLAADIFLEREAAQDRLRSWAEAFPRYLLTELAEAYRTVEDLEAEHRLEKMLHELAAKQIFYRPFGFIGVNFQPRMLPTRGQVIEVIGIVNGEAADKAGLRMGDFLLEVGGVSVTDMEGANGFVDHVSALLPGEEVELRVERGGTQFKVDLVLGVRMPPAIEHAAYIREQEARIREWLDSLKEEPADPERPAGHFRLTPSAEEAGAVEPVE
jgi:hypothetical protein